MDANGLRFWMWSEARDYVQLDDCSYDAARRRLTLEREREPPVEAGRAVQAEQRLGELPWLRDAWGTLARWDVTDRVLRGFGVMDGSVPVPGTGAAQSPNDLAIDADQVVLLAFDAFVDLVDLRERFEPLRLEAPVLDGGETFVTSKMACDGLGNRWLLDRRHRRIARIRGRPWRTRSFVDFDPDTFRPAPENHDAPRIELVALELSSDFDFVLIAVSRAGRVLLAGWGPDGRFSIHPLEIEADRFVLGAARQLEGADHGHSIQWLDETLIAIRAGALDEALAFAVDSPDRPLQVVGARYPLRRARGGPFVQSQDWPPHYPSEPEALPDDYPRLQSRPLVPLSWRAARGEGRAAGRVIDGGTFGMTWHRLYIEAAVPAGCGIVVELAALDEDVVPADADFHSHFVGEPAAMPALAPETPRAAWLRTASEIPHHPGLLPCPQVPQRAGLYSVLVQRADRQVRGLCGRWLHLRLRLLGNRRESPELAAIRIYGARYSYVSRYLPELYRDEAVFDRTAMGRATRHDFLERFVDLFEGELTRWEDLAADARVLTHPASCPEGALTWLASFTGLRTPPALPAERTRAWLASGAERARRRGTLSGLQLALDIATAGAVSRGAIIVVEDFRLRRTVATLLGVDMERDDDPLLPGLVVSGNSFVGDTLILGDETVEREFLAAFLPEALKDTVGGADAQAFVESFYARTAQRATVLVHEDLDAALLRLVEAIVDEEAPAHVDVKIIAARLPLLVGIASLVEVDTYLREPPAVRVARIDVSRIGRGDIVEGGAAFDWRLEAGVASPGNPPTAVIDGPALVDFASSFGLSGSRSTAAPGHELSRFTWTRHPG